VETIGGHTTRRVVCRGRLGDTELLLRFAVGFDIESTNERERWTKYRASTRSLSRLARIVQ
jgi:hypothetical protein